MKTLNLDLYLALRRLLKDSGYGREWDWSQSLSAPASSDDLADEAIWVILNSGMKNQIARNIADRLYPALKRGRSASTVFRHEGKAQAIDGIWLNRQAYFEAFMALPADPELQVAWCGSLPWIGAITSWHLAKNLGVDTIKPDRHIARLCGFENWEAADPVNVVDAAHRLFKPIHEATGDRYATIDLVVWRGFNLQLLEMNGRFLQHDAMLEGPVCRSCGCTMLNACHDEETGCGCHWVEAALCSVCARSTEQKEGSIKSSHGESADGGLSPQQQKPRRKGAKSRTKITKPTRNRRFSSTGAQTGARV